MDTFDPLAESFVFFVDLGESINALLKVDPSHGSFVQVLRYHLFGDLLREALDDYFLRVFWLGDWQSKRSVLCVEMSRMSRLVAAVLRLCVQVDHHVLEILNRLIEVDDRSQLAPSHLTGNIGMGVFS